MSQIFAVEIQVSDSEVRGSDDSEDDSGSRVDELTFDVSEELSSDSDAEMDIDALLSAATTALADNKQKPAKMSDVKQLPRSSLIRKQGGVAKLNPDVLNAQTSKQTLAQKTEKVSDSRSELRDEGDMMTTFYM